jgi:trehalose 6-phosphate synthase
MWDSITNPTINKTTWEAWQNGYVAANQKFAQVVARRVRADAGRTVVMLQDYHLYLLPRMLRRILRKTRRSDQLTLTHFVHIPWPGSDELRILPQEMRQSILEGLMAVDILGFQTYSDTINFLQSAATHLPGVSVSYKKRKIWYRNHPTIVRDFPISIDVRALQDFSIADEVQAHKEILLQFAQNYPLSSALTDGT